MDYEGIKTLLHRAQEGFFLASAICGWTRATVERTRARTGWRRPWGGAWSSSRVRASLPPKRCLGRGEGMGQRGRGGRLGEALAAQSGVYPIFRTAPKSTSGLQSMQRLEFYRWQIPEARV